MILVDANLLIYAHVPDMSDHLASRVWLERVLAGPGRVGIPWASILAFIRIRTNPRVFRAPLDVGAAWAAMESLLDQPLVWIPEPGPGHRGILGEIVRQCRPTAGLIHDAHLAALAMEHGLTMCSTDADFGRFPGLRWQNPIARKEAPRG